MKKDNYDQNPKRTLEITHPNLAKEWDIEKNGDLTPSTVTAGSGKVVFWKCPICGHSWKTSVQHRTQGTGCPVCVGKIPFIGKNDLATLHPDIASEWDSDQNDGHMPSEFLSNSNRVVSWKCKDGHTWKSKISTRVRYDSECPYCAGCRPIEGKTDLSTTHPDIAGEWDYEANVLTPKEVTAGSTKKVNWICKHNHPWKASVCNRTQGKGCPFCAHKRPVKGETDLQTTHPEIAKEWDYERNGDLQPTDVTAGSGRKVWWICPDTGLSYKANICDRCSKGSKSPYTTGKKPVPGVTDLATTHPHLASQWHPTLNRFTASHYTAGSETKAWWKCMYCGHEWMARISSRTHQDTRCPRCRK